MANENEPARVENLSPLRVDEPEDIETIGRQQIGRERDIAYQRETTRGMLARWLLILLSGVVLVSFGSMWVGCNSHIDARLYPGALLTQ